MAWSGKRVPPPRPPAWRAGALLAELFPVWPARSVSSRRPHALQAYALPLSYRRSHSSTSVMSSVRFVTRHLTLDTCHPRASGIVPRICPRNLRLRKAVLCLVELGRQWLLDQGSNLE